MQRPRIAILFHRLGPYHVARLHAAARVLPMVAIESSGVDVTYAWDQVTGSGDFERVTLFEHADAQHLPKAEVVRRVVLAFDTVAPTVVVIPGWADVVALAALRWCVAHQVPAVVMSETQAIDEPRVAWKEWIKRRIVGLASTALVGGRPHADYMQQLGMSGDRVFLGYDAVDNGYFAAEAARWRGRRSEGGGQRTDQAGFSSTIRDPQSAIPHAPYFLASNRFIEKKNLFRLLDAYAGYVNRDQRPETRDQRPEIRDQRPETRDKRPETRDQRPETRDQRSETRDKNEEEGHGQLGRVLHEEEGHGQLGRVLHEEEGHGQLGRVLHEEVTGGPPVPLLLHGHSAQAQPTSDLRPPTSDLWPLVLLGDGELKPQLLAHCAALGLHVIESAPWEAEEKAESGMRNAESEVEELSPTSDLRPPTSDLRPPTSGTVFFPGFRQIGELPRFYAHAGAFVHASTTEQWGLVVNEAMACGLPVIVSNRVGCAQDLVQDGVNGYTFDPYDVEQLAQLMHRLTEAPKHRLSEMGDASRAIIADWGPERFAAGLKAAVDKALEVGPKRAGLFDRLILKALMLR
jgi:glycosyltransferase involved in cell wall biosynthesis